MGTILIWIVGVAAVALVVAAVAYLALEAWGANWGATRDEIDAQMSGDELLRAGPEGAVRCVFTRAISIAAAPDDVWPWVAQLGRGAGFYSYDRLDNGGKPSADHLVSWIPEMRLGDASAIGYLRSFVPGRETLWYLDGEPWLGAVFRMICCFHLTAEGEGSRLVLRVSGDAVGGIARPVLWAFTIIDSLMARRQLLGFKERAERGPLEGPDGAGGETGAREQYQLYEVIYADGTTCGIHGKEKAPRWRETAQRDLGERMGATDGSPEGQ